MENTDPTEPGYYASDIRRLSFGEFRRLGQGGILGAVLFYLFRSFLTVEFNEGQWLPQKWNELVVDPEELTQNCLEKLLPQISSLERQGFHLVAYHKLTKHLYPLSVDNGGAFLIHSDGDYCASVVWTRNRLMFPHMGETKLLITCIYTSCVSGKVVTVGDSDKILDPTPPREVVFMCGASVKTMWERIQQIRFHLDSIGEESLKIRNVADLERCSNYQEARTWNERVHVRKLMVKMTDAQVEAARRRMPQGDD